MAIARGCRLLGSIVSNSIYPASRTGTSVSRQSEFCHGGCDCVWESNSIALPGVATFISTPVGVTAISRGLSKRHPRTGIENGIAPRQGCQQRMKYGTLERQRSFSRDWPDQNEAAFVQTKLLRPLRGRLQRRIAYPGVSLRLTPG